MSSSELIHLPNTLAKRIGPRVRVFTAGLLKQAESALAKVSEHYEDWLRQDLAALESIRSDIASGGMTTAKLRELGRCARQLRGSGATFGYPIVTSFAAHLCDAVGQQNVAVPRRLIDGYVDAMKAAVRDQVHDVDHPPAAAIIAELQASLASPEP